MDTQSDAVKAIDATFDRAMAQLNEALAIARQALEQRDEAQAQVKALREALEAVCQSARKQLEGHGKGIQPSVRLEEAFALARAALAKAGA